jgi:hypothetical protein
LGGGILLRDVTVNLLIALPFAAAFLILPALRGWTYVTLATAASVIAGYGSETTIGALATTELGR